MAVDHELVAVDSGTAGPRYAAEACVLVAAGLDDVNLVNAVGVKLSSNPQIRRRRFTKPSNEVADFWTDLTRQAS